MPTAEEEVATSTSPRIGTDASLWKGGGDLDASSAVAAPALCTSFQTGIATNMASVATASATTTPLRNERPQRSTPRREVKRYIGSVIRIRDSKPALGQAVGPKSIPGRLLGRCGLLLRTMMANQATGYKPPKQNSRHKVTHPGEGAIRNDVIRRVFAGRNALLRPHSAGRA